MFSIKIEAATTEKLREQLQYFLQNGFNVAAPVVPAGAAPATAPLPASPGSPEAPAAAAPQQPTEAKKPGRKPKAEAPVAGPTAPSPAAPAPAAPAASQTPPAAAAPTPAARPAPAGADAEVWAAALAVNDKLGMSVVAEILKKYANCSRIQEVKPENKAAVIKACNDAVTA